MVQDLYFLVQLFLDVAAVINEIVKWSIAFRFSLRMGQMWMSKVQMITVHCITHLELGRLKSSRYRLFGGSMKIGMCHGSVQTGSP